jgi:hypothetical protein
MRTRQPVDRAGQHLQGVRALQLNVEFAVTAIEPALSSSANYYLVVDRLRLVASSSDSSESAKV